MHCAGIFLEKNEMTHRLFGFCESPFRRHVNFLEREGDPLPKPPAATRLICLCVASMWILEPMPTLEFFWFLFLWAKNGRVRERWRVVAVCSHQRCAWGTRATAHTRRLLLRRYRRSFFISHTRRWGGCKKEKEGKKKKKKKKNEHRSKRTVRR